MRIFLFTTVFSLLSLLMLAQGPVGSWQDHLPYFTARTVAIGTEEVFASTGSSLLIYNKEFNELRKMGKVQGLSETGISTIAWSPDKKSLIIAYQSTNIDILTGNNIYNIPDIKRKYIPGNKEIYKIRTRTKYAYLAGSFGIAVLDIERKEIYDTWKPGDESTEIYDIAFDGTTIYAATTSGLFYANINNPGLSYSGNWTRINSFPDSSVFFNSVIFLNNKIYANLTSSATNTDTIYTLVNYTDISVFSVQPGIKNLALEKYSGGFTVVSQGMIKVFDSDGKLVDAITSYNYGTPDISHAMADGSDIWIADKSNGLIKCTGSTNFLKLNLSGPFSNSVLSIVNSNGKTYITGGALDNSWNNQWRSFQVFIHQNNNWHSEISYDLHDPLRILPDPLNLDRFWVSTWGAGLLVYENNILKGRYNDANSPLETIIPGKPYSRICGLAMDSKRNIWITQTGVPGSIKILKPDSTWITLPVTIDAPTIGDILISSAGHKWIILPRGFGLFVIDDNNTPDEFNDDRYKQMLVKDTDNKVISNIYSIAEDLDGNIWVGTDQGPAVYYNPSRIFDEDLKAFRAKVPRNDGSGLADYMLGTEIISSIAIDGANRKWVGTYNSGVYLLSADGTTQLVNYNEENSPLFSNNVLSIAVDGKTGEVWIGTAKGVLSVRGDATTGADRFTNVYAFPNPVRETYEGNLTITGLMRNTSVRITDVSGNLVYKTVSNGGQATWDLKTYTGERVSTGVYLIFCASEDGRNTSLTKVLVIK
ncbi:MAG: type IX secretion system anionic LPS delivery protein PorZ [Bacteroidales bacterium]